MAGLAAFRHKESGFSDLLPWAGLVENGILLLKDGSLMAGWYFMGPDPMSTTPMERNQLSARINALFARLGTGWMIQTDAIRLPVSQYPSVQDCHFPDPVSSMIDQERRQHFESSNRHYESQYALTLTYRTPDEVPGKLARFIYSNTDESITFADEQLAYFRQSITEFEGELSDIVQTRRMITHETVIESGKQAEYDDLCQLIRFCMTGENHPIRLPTIPFYLDSILAAEFHHGLTPIVENRFIAAVTIDGFPSESTPGILNVLDQMPLNYRWHTRFIVMEPEEARIRLERQRKKWAQKVRPLFDQLFQTNSGAADRDALTMVDQTEEAMAEANAGQVIYGLYTSAIILFDEDEEQLYKMAEAVRRVIASEGFGARIETINAIARQIALMAARPNNRSLSDFVAGVQQRDLQDALHPYTVDGSLGHLLDAETDNLNMSTFQCFEIEELMQMGERILVPVLSYLFRRIEKRLDGRPSLIILDEAWLMLGHTTFREKIREWLKTLRKANCAVVLATQSISDAARSGIIDVLIESCPTKILLPNPAARESDMAGFYSRIGLNEQEINLIAQARPKQDYYTTSPDGKRLFDMQLDPITLAFTGASSKEDIKAIRQLYHQHGANWPQEWLKGRGIAHA